MKGTAPTYEPRFYERAAQRWIAQWAAGDFYANVRWGVTGSPSTRPEIDGLIVAADRRVTAVEVKAFPVDLVAFETIVAKYADLGFSSLLLVSPGFGSSVAGRARRTLDGLRVHLRSFEPDLLAIRQWYEEVWPSRVPAWVHDALASGRHHVRFMLARPTERGSFVVGQQRTRVYDVATVSRLIALLPGPPIRVLWTPQRFTIPRDLSARGSRLNPMGGYIPVDIDGDRLHNANYACHLDRSGACPFCDLYAYREVARLTALIEQTPIDVLSSGGRGVHAYFGSNVDRPSVLRLAADAKVRLDVAVTASLRATVSLPGSLHAAGMRPVARLSPSTREGVSACS